MSHVKPYTDRNILTKRLTDTKKLCLDYAYNKWHNHTKPLTDPKKRLDFDLRASYLEADDTGMSRVQRQGQRLGRPASGILKKGKSD